MKPETLLVYEDFRVDNADPLKKQVGNPTLTTSQLKTRDSKDSARA
jgi:hypothetical protein